ncbi:MAG: YegP family protein [Saprospirales bacterium]|nr:YegP family protein [Saprospirales bacterium]MBK8492326.1 YegP family protein [Saprospirales bacterium]
MKFEVFKGKNGEFYFSLFAKNGQKILGSEGYSSKAACMNGVESVRKNAASADNFEVKTASDGRTYFNLKASNGQSIGKSQMYKSRSGLKGGIESVQANAASAPVVERED